MAQVKIDPAWDNSSGGVRCSSVGEDASKYLDPSTHNFEGSGGRSLSSLLPTSNGLRGVIIPRATRLGGSLGFDPQKSGLVNIDPDIKGQSCVVDFSQITKETMAAAMSKASENPLTHTDLSLHASQTFHNLACGFEPVGMKSNQSPLNNRQSPIPGTAYVTPKAALGGGQVQEKQAMNSYSNDLSSPSVRPRGHIKPPQEIIKQAIIKEPEVETSYEEYAESMPEYKESPVNQPFQDQTIKQIIKDKPKINQNSSISVPRNRNVNIPEIKVQFEMEGWGTFEAVYHQVIKNDCLLVLVYDESFKGGMRFYPPATDKVIAVKIEGKDNVFFVNSYGNKFQHGGYEYCLLVIDQESHAGE